jgi:hypothetical protein
VKIIKDEKAKKVKKKNTQIDIDKGETHWTLNRDVTE